MKPDVCGTVDLDDEDLDDEDDDEGEDEGSDDDDDEDSPNLKQQTKNKTPNKQNMATPKKTPVTNVRTQRFQSLIHLLQLFKNYTFGLF